MTIAIKPTCKFSHLWEAHFQRWLVNSFDLHRNVHEALNPGPEDCIHIGCINPTGLRHKANLVSSLPTPGIWGVSETHLSHRGLHQFRTELSHQQKILSITPGAPAPLRSSSVHATGGKACGVATLSTEPTRALPNSFPPEIFATSRLQTTVTHWQDDWIMGGVVYGFSAGSQTLPVQGQTNELVAHVVQRIANQCTGKRYICGDWNQPHQLLECSRTLREQGWLEAQDLAELRWGRAPRPTCSTGNRIDFLWLSPELIPFVEEVNVEEVGFPDHYGLWVQCRSWRTEAPTPYWRMPVPINWDALNPKLRDAEVSLDDFVVPPTLSCTHDQHASNAQYLSLATAFEDAVQKALHACQEPALRTPQLGRASTLSVSLKKKRAGPLRASRPGDHQPGVQVDSYLYACMFRQLRRLQHLARACQRNDKSIAQLDHIAILWQAIVKAKGFRPNFAAWCQVNLLQDMQQSTQGGPRARAPKSAHEMHLGRRARARTPVMHRWMNTDHLTIHKCWPCMMP